LATFTLDELVALRPISICNTTSCARSRCSGHRRRTGRS
jgi:hypothetical protein